MVVSIGLTEALILSPEDYKQSHSVRIMYVHVPAAWISLGIFSTITILSIIVYIFKIKNFFLGSIIGMAPQLFVGVSLGDGLNRILEENQDLPTFFELILSPDIYLPIIGIIILVLIALYLRKSFFK